MTVLPSAGRTFRASLLTPDRATRKLRYFEDAIFSVGADGRIRSLDSASAVLARGELGVVRDLRPGLVVPGYVDAHVHFPQTRVIGSATGPLLDWLSSTIFPEEARFRDEAYAEAVAAEMVHRFFANGTTAAAVYSSSDPGATRVLAGALGRAGMRGLVGLTLMDRGCPAELAVAADVALPEARALAREVGESSSGRLAFAVTPRFALSCSRALMEGAARLADELGLFVQTHVAENAREGVETLAAHPIADDYLGVYEAVGLVGPRTIFAHAIHFSQSEWDRIAARGARIAHCPDSNFFLGSGVMKLDEATRRGVPTALGSDVAAGRSFSMRRAIAHAHDAALASGSTASPATLFTMATLGGAELLGLGDVAG
ncbi:MAG TPA: amidohydrolase family protein, partial [Polyangiaceae bacterium]|nr:amidohydrolase family protein [Polyangiaceae bacterium]